MPFLVDPDTFLNQQESAPEPAKFQVSPEDFLVRQSSAATQPSAKFQVSPEEFLQSATMQDPLKATSPAAPASATPAAHAYNGPLPDKSLPLSLNFKPGDELPEDEDEDFKVGGAFWDTPEQSAKAEAYNKALDAWKQQSAAPSAQSPSSFGSGVPYATHQPSIAGQLREQLGNLPAVPKPLPPMGPPPITQNAQILPEEAPPSSPAGTPPGTVFVRPYAAAPPQAAKESILPAPVQKLADELRNTIGVGPFGAPFEGADEIAKGVYQIGDMVTGAQNNAESTPQLKGTPAGPVAANQGIAGFADIVRGGLKIGSVLVPYHAITSPISTVATLATYELASKGTETALKAAGVPEDYSELAGDIAGMGAGAAIHSTGALDTVREMFAPGGRFGEGIDPKTLTDEQVMYGYMAARQAGDQAKMEIFGNEGIRRQASYASDEFADAQGHWRGNPPVVGQIEATNVHTTEPPYVKQLPPGAGGEPPSPAGPEGSPGPPLIDYEALAKQSGGQPLAPPPAGTSSAPPPPAAVPNDTSSPEGLRQAAQEIGGTPVVAPPNEKPAESNENPTAPTPAGSPGEPVKPQAPLEDTRSQGEPLGPTANETRPQSEQAEQPKHEFASTQANLPDEVADQVRAAGDSIPKDELAKDGTEPQPHITALYGLHADNPGQVRELLKDQPPITVTLGNASIFPAADTDASRGGAGDSDVLKVDVDSPDLHRINALLRQLPHTNDFPVYQPHITIAYLKRGEGKKYDGNNIPGVTGQTITLTSIAFSGKDGKQVEIPLTGKAPDTAQKGSIPPANVQPSGAASPEVIRSSAQVQNDLDNFAPLPGETHQQTVARKGMLTAELMKATAADMGNDQALAEAADRIQRQREAAKTAATKAQQGTQTIDVTPEPESQIARKPESQTDLSQRILDSLKTKPGGMGTGQLREELGAPKPEFDQAMLALYRNRQIHMDEHDWPAGLSEEQKHDLVGDGNGRYYVVAGIREPEASEGIARDNAGSVAEKPQAASPNQPIKPGVSGSAETPSTEPRVPALPHELSGAKPRYNSGPKSFSLDFANDLDKAAYITAQPKPSKQDQQYVDFVKQYTGLSEPEIRKHGAAIKAGIKELAKSARPGTPAKPKPLAVPAHEWPKSQRPAPPAQTEGGNLPPGGNEGGKATLGGMDPDELRVRQETLAKLHANPEHYLAEYTKRFGNVLNADDAATLFDEYNQDPMKYRVAVHPAATWIRDELFRRALAEKAPEGKNHVFFTAGSNAAGKSTALSLTNAPAESQVAFDSTFSNPEHARKLVEQALAANKRVGVLFVQRPLEEAFQGMLDRAETEGRVVSINQLMNSHQGAAASVRALYQEFADDPRFRFQFVDNSGATPQLSTIELAAPQDYTGVKEHLHELLDAEYDAGRITEATYRRIGGRREPGQPRNGGQGGAPGGGGSPQTGEAETPAEGSGPGSVSPEATSPDTNRQIAEAQRAWLENRAYLDNRGNYHLRPEAATLTHKPNGPIAPWNKLVKTAFPSVTEFSKAARAAEERRQAPEKTATSDRTVEFGKESTYGGRKQLTAFGRDAEGNPTDRLTLRQAHGDHLLWNVEHESYATPPGPQNRYGHTVKRQIGGDYSKAEAKQVAEAFLKGEPNPFAAAENGLPISEYKPGSGKIHAPETGFGQNTVNGTAAWTDGHVAFQGTAPGPLSAAKEQPDIQVAWKVAKKDGKRQFTPAAFFRDRAIPQVVLTDRAGNAITLAAQYFDLTNKLFPDATFKGSDASGAVAVFSHGQMVGVIMPMRHTLEDLPAGVQEILKAHPQGPLPEAATKTLTAAQKRKSALTRRREIYTPGNVVTGYGGTPDRVLNYQEGINSFGHPSPGGFRVQVQELDKDGNAIGQPRWHSTAPDKSAKVLSSASGLENPQTGENSPSSQARTLKGMAGGQPPKPDQRQTVEATFTAGDKDEAGVMRGNREASRLVGMLHAAVSGSYGSINGLNMPAGLVELMRNEGRRMLHQGRVPITSGGNISLNPGDTITYVDATGTAKKARFVGTRHATGAVIVELTDRPGTLVDVPLGRLDLQNMKRVPLTAAERGGLQRLLPAFDRAVESGKELNYSDTDFTEAHEAFHTVQRRFGERGDVIGHANTETLFYGDDSEVAQRAADYLIDQGGYHKSKEVSLEDHLHEIAAEIGADLYAGLKTGDLEETAASMGLEVEELPALLKLYQHALVAAHGEKDLYQNPAMRVILKPSHAGFEHYQPLRSRSGEGDEGESPSAVKESPEPPGADRKTSNGGRPNLPPQSQRELAARIDRAGSGRNRQGSPAVRGDGRVAAGLAARLAKPPDQPGGAEAAGGLGGRGLEGIPGENSSQVASRPQRSDLPGLSVSAGARTGSGLASRALASRRNPQAPLASERGPSSPLSPSANPLAIRRIASRPYDHSGSGGTIEGLLDPDRLRELAPGELAAAEEALRAGGYDDPSHYVHEVFVRAMEAGRLTDELQLSPEQADRLAAAFVKVLIERHGERANEAAERIYQSYPKSYPETPERSNPRGTGEVQQQRSAIDRSGTPGRRGPPGRIGPPLSQEGGSGRPGSLTPPSESFLASESGAFTPSAAIDKLKGTSLETVTSPEQLAKQAQGSIQSALTALRTAAEEPSDTQFGEKLRTLVTGERDVRIAETNQLRDQLRRLIPNHVDQEALTLMRDFKNRPGELEQFLNGTHPFYTELKLKPPERVTATERMQKLRPVVERALHPSPEMVQADNALTKYFTEHLEEGQKLGFLDSKISNEEYITHLLQPEEGQKGPTKLGQLARGKLSRNFKFSKARHYPTILHALAGGASAKTLNALDALAIYGDKYATNAAYWLFRNAVKESAVGKFGTYKQQQAGKIPRDWVELAPESHLFRNEVPLLDENGEPTIAHQMMFVPPKLRDAMRPILDPNYLNRLPYFQRSSVFQAYIKAVQLGLSVFHLKALNMTALGNQNLDGLVQSYLNSMHSPEFLAAERTWIRAGLTTPVLDRAIEVYHGLKQSSLPTLGQRLRSAPGIKQVDRLAAGISHLTFGIVQRKFKVVDASLQYAKWIAKHPNDTPAELFEAQRAIARQVNATYGGLHWENLGVHQTTLGLARAIALAPDWTFSNYLNASYAFEGGPAGQSARKYWIMAGIWAIALGEATSILLTGHPSKDPTQVYLGKNAEGKDIYINAYFTGGEGDLVTLVRDVNRLGGIEGTAYFLAGKLGSLPKAAMSAAVNAAQGRTIVPKTVDHTLLGRRVLPYTPNVLEKTALGAKELVKQAAPVPFSASTIAKMLTDGKQHSMAEYIATAIAGREPQQLSPDETRAKLKEDIADALRAGDKAKAGELAKQGAGLLTNEDIRQAVKQARQLKEVEQFSHLPLPGAIEVMRDATPEERSAFMKPLVHRLRQAFPKLSPEERQSTIEQLKAAHISLQDMQQAVPQ
jgi:hypothetical protein